MHPSTRQTGTVAGFDPDVHMANWEVIRRPYVLIRNEPEADTEKLAVLTDKAEDLPATCSRPPGGHVLVHRQ